MNVEINEKDLNSLMNDFYFPRVYLNLSRSLADKNLWDDMVKNKNEENDEKLNNIGLCLLSGVIVFCYMTLESFVNDHIEKKDPVNFKLSERKELGEKLKILCILSEIESIELDDNLWIKFTILKSFRNAFVHMKKLRITELFHKYYYENQPHFFLQTTIDIIKYYYLKTNNKIPKYLEGNLFSISKLIYS